MSDLFSRKPLAAVLMAATVSLSALLPAPAHASPPVILDLSCPGLPYGPDILCTASYSSTPLPISIEWSGADGTVVNAAPGVTRFFAQCANGDSVRITVKVTNIDGSSTMSTKRYRCIA